jgi:phosphoglycolate phosphatase
MTAPYLVMLDCDGTLVDSQAGIIDAMRAAFLSLSLTPPADLAIRRIVGLPVETGVALLAPSADETTVETLSGRFRDAYAGLRRADQLEEPLYPHMLEALDRLEAGGATLGIATGKSRRGLLATLDRHQIRARFAVLQTADDAAGKPAPDMLLNAMGALGFRRERTMMVGDTSFDMQMAKTARVVPIGVSWGYHEREDLIAAGAVQVLDEVIALPDIALQIFGTVP